MGALVATSAAAAFVGTGVPSAGAASTITVTDPGNAGAGTLRDALANAADGDTIVFAPGVTTVSVTARLLVEDAVTIDGAGLVTVQGNNTDTVFYLDAPGNANITISGLTITGGHGLGGGRAGGGIDNTDEHLTVNSSVITGNTSVDWGAGINADSAGNTLTLLNSAVTGNTADDGGGGIKLDNSTALDITASSVSNNHATGGNDGGGGLYLSTIDGDVNITGSIIDGNTVDGQGGGGFYADDIEGALTITNTSISGNTAAVEGGGFYADYVLGAINITGATINNNTAGSGGGGAYFDEAHGGVTISNSTISGNSSDSNGGGLYVDFFYEGFTIQNTTISGNSAARPVVASTTPRAATAASSCSTPPSRAIPRATVGVAGSTWSGATLRP